MRLIDADNVIERLLQIKPGLLHTRPFLDMLHNTPTVDAEPVKHGHWICVDCGDYEECVCSVCGGENFGENYMIGSTANYCPHCGAKMDEEGEDDT